MPGISGRMKERREKPREEEGGRLRKAGATIWGPWEPADLIKASATRPSLKPG